MFNNNEIIVRFNEFVYDKKLKHICDVYPIVPAKKIENSWWQIMKSHYDIFLSKTRKEFKSAAPTLKYCPGIYDFTNYGYIVPAWQDIQFRVDEIGLVEWIVPPTMQQVPNITIHNREQVSTCPILDDTTNVGLVILKLISLFRDFLRKP